MDGEFGTSRALALAIAPTIEVRATAKPHAPDNHGDNQGFGPPAEPQPLYAMHPDLWRADADETRGVVQQLLAQRSVLPARHLPWWRRG